MLQSMLIFSASSNAASATVRSAGPSVDYAPTLAGWFIGGIALLAAIICFAIFLRRLWSKPRVDEVAGEAIKAAGNRGFVAGAAPLDASVLAGFGKAIGEALSKLGPELIGLVGAFMFLLLAGQAWRVWEITGSFGDAETVASETGSGSNESGNDQAGEGNSGTVDGNVGEPSKSANSVSE